MTCRSLYQFAALTSLLLAMLIEPAISRKTVQAAAETPQPPPVGRLFFAPNQRGAMDQQRASNRPQNKQAIAPQISIDGLVQRSDGKPTVWLNGRPLSDKDAGPGTLRAVPGQSAQINLGLPNEPRRTVTVGSVVDRGSNEVRTPLGRGKIDVRQQP